MSKNKEEVKVSKDHQAWLNENPREFLLRFNEEALLLKDSWMIKQFAILGRECNPTNSLTHW